jgi:ABC-type uncharacterized transport system permease subunit
MNPIYFSGAIFGYKTSRSTAYLITVQVEQLKSNNSSRKFKKKKKHGVFSRGLLATVGFARSFAGFAVCWSQQRLQLRLAYKLSDQMAI